MSEELELETRLRTRYRAASLPSAPDRLRELLADLSQAELGRSNRAEKRWMWAGLVALIGVVGLASVAALIGSSPSATASLAPASAAQDLASHTPKATVAPTDPPGTMTVSQVLADRAGGGLRNVAVALKGYWSDRSFGHSCTAPTVTPGELEIRCHDGESGITENNEPVLTFIDGSHRLMPAAGPHLTPWMPEAFARELYSLPIVNGVAHPPVPIVVIGHFDDPRADACQPEARQRCLDRLVIDEIVSFDPASVPPPTPTPIPTPFPFEDPPPAKFGSDMCQGDIPYSFVGWTTMADLGIDIGGEGHIYAMVTRDVVALSGWVDDPAGSGQRFRAFGRQVCYAWEWHEGAMGFATLPGSGYRDWDDGHREFIDP